MGKYSSSALRSCAIKPLFFASILTGGFCFLSLTFLRDRVTSYVSLRSGSQGGVGSNGALLVNSTRGQERSPKVTEGRHSHQRQENRVEKGVQTKRRILKILDFNHRKLIPHNYTFVGCEYSNCAFTKDHRQADLVMINAARIKNGPVPPKHPGQIWLLYSKEPPTFHRFSHLDRPDFHELFNWTRMAFTDSTFQGVYGELEERIVPLELKDYKAIFENKTKEVAWFVSHCPTQSRREVYAQRMSKNIDVDIYGKCGNMTCGSKAYTMGDDHLCLRMLSREYKFYLSFENSMCENYVTEKFFNMYNEVDVIPVVRGGADYEHRFSAGTFVNAKNFNSPEALAMHLKELSRDKYRYIGMLKRKNRFFWIKPKFECDLCKALNTQRPLSVYGDVHAWIMSHCWEPDDL